MRRVGLVFTLCACLFQEISGTELISTLAAEESRVETVATSIDLAEAEKSLGEFRVYASEVYGSELDGITVNGDVVTSLRMDPRVHQLLVAYDQLTPELARKRVRVLWIEWFNEHRNRLTKVMKQWRSDGGHDVSSGLKDSGYACAAAVLLMTRYGSDKDLRDALLRWQLARDTIVGVKPSATPSGVLVSSTSPGNRVPDSIYGEAGPDDLFVISMCLTRVRNSRESKKGRQTAQDQMKIHDRAVVTRLAASSKPALDLAGAAMQVHYVRSWSDLTLGREIAGERYVQFALNALKSDQQ